MQDFVDELDLRVLNCLQVSPRASWSVIGRILDVDPTTIARRWSRLESAGLAWVTYHDGSLNGSGVAAYVEIETVGAPVSAIASEIASHRCVASVHHTTGSRSLVASVVDTDPAAISRFVSDSLATIHGVAATRLEIVTARYSDAGQWRLRVLTPEQLRALQAASSRQNPLAASPSHPDDQHIIQLLASDGRISTTEIARSLAVSEPTARRRLNRLLSTESVTLRCEISQAISGWPQTGILWARAPVGVLDAVARRLSAAPVVRACVTLTGRNNLMLFAWLRNVTDLYQFERAVSDAAPALEVADRAYCLRSFKRSGRLIDDDGRSAGLARSPWTEWQ